VPGVLVVGSLIESQSEAGGPKGVQALLRLEWVFGRVQSSWQPAAGDETYEIIRRRVFAVRGRLRNSASCPRRTF
jgi:hypothetical protein